MQPITSDIVRARLRRWFGPILDETGWRSNLVDAQAEHLLNWGMAQVAQTAVHTQRLPDEDADPLLEKDSTAVRLIMVGVNDLIGTPTMKRTVRPYASSWLG